MTIFKLFLTAAVKTTRTAIHHHFTPTQTAVHHHLRSTHLPLIHRRFQSQPTYFDRTSIVGPDTTMKVNSNVYMKRGPTLPMDSWEEKGSARFRFDVPCVSKNDVKLRVEGNRVMIEAVGKKSPFFKGGDYRVYDFGFALNPVFHDISKLQAEIVNGVIYINVPLH